METPVKISVSMGFWSSNPHFINDIYIFILKGHFKICSIYICIRHTAFVTNNAFAEILPTAFPLSGFWNFGNVPSTMFGFVHRRGPLGGSGHEAEHCGAGGWRRVMRQTLEGSFSTVSKRNFAGNYAFESSRRDLHNELLCTALKSHFF